MTSKIVLWAVSSNERSRRCDMARAARATESTKLLTKKPKTAGRKKEVTAAPITSPEQPQASKRVAAVMSPPAPRVSKEELRAQVEKLERILASLRAKSRETNKAAKTAIVSHHRA